MVYLPWDPEIENRFSGESTWSFGGLIKGGVLESMQ